MPGVSAGARHCLHGKSSGHKHWRANDKMHGISIHFESFRYISILWMRSPFCHQHRLYCWIMFASLVKQILAEFKILRSKQNKAHHGRFEELWHYASIIFDRRSPQSFLVTWGRNISAPWWTCSRTPRLPVWSDTTKPRVDGKISNNCVWNIWIFCILGTSTYFIHNWSH